MGVLVGASFIVCALVQIEMNKYITVTPGKDEHGLRFINSDVCPLKINVGDQAIEIPPRNASEIVFINIATTHESLQYTDCGGNLRDISFDSSTMLPEKVTD